MGTLIAFFLYFINPNKLIKDSFRGHLMVCNIVLPRNITDQIADDLFEMYIRKKKINSEFGRGMKSNLDFMTNLVMGEAYYIKHLLNPNTKKMVFDRREKTISNLKKNGYKLYGIKD